MNTKRILTVATLLLVGLVVNAQNCKKFVDYQTKDVNIGGIKLALGLGQGGNTESSKITSIMRNADEKVQQLDLLQYNLCNQLKNIKSESIKEKLIYQANNVMTKILNLAGNTTETTATSSIAKNTAVSPQTAKAVAVSENPAEETTTETKEPIVQPAVTQVVEDEDVDVEINTPCSGENFYSTNDIIRGTGEGWSMDAQMAKRAARTAALEDLAAKIEITVKTLCEDYQISKKNGLDEIFVQQLENKTKTVVNQTISGWKTICEKMAQNKKSKNYRAYMAVEINIKQILDGTYTQLKADAAIANQLPSKAEFDKRFNEIMGEVEQSNEIVIPEF